MFMYFPVEKTRVIILFSVLIWAWLSINSLFILMKINIYRQNDKVSHPFLNLGSVLMFYLNFMEIIPMTALEFLLDPINSFKPKLL